MKKGRSPSAQSAAAFTEPIAYVMPTAKAVEKHLLLAGWLFQNSATARGEPE